MSVFLLHRDLYHSALKQHFLLLFFLHVQILKRRTPSSQKHFFFLVFVNIDFHNKKFRLKLRNNMLVFKKDLTLLKFLAQKSGVLHIFLV